MTIRNSTRSCIRPVKQVALACLAIAVFATTVAAQASTRRIANNTPGFVTQATIVGHEQGSKLINLTLWLQPHNASGLHELVQQLYQKGSPNYHQWLTPEQFHAYFAPKPEEARVVQDFLTAHNLSVLSVDESNLSVKAQGRVADVERAFQVRINKFKVNGAIHRANMSDPLIEGPAGSLVAAVGGMDDYDAQPHSIRQIDPDTGQPFPGVAIAPGPNGVFFEGQCFRHSEFVKFTTNGGLPVANYAGNRYGADISNTQNGHLAPCGYSPAEMQTAYNLTSLYNAGLDGTGQTIVIVDAFGSTTIQQDAELFSQIYGLPDLTPSNFQIIGTPTGASAGWAAETTLDVEWAHAVAPNAKIVLIVAQLTASRTSTMPYAAPWRINLAT